MLDLVLEVVFDEAVISNYVMPVRQVEFLSICERLVGFLRQFFKTGGVDVDDEEPTWTQVLCTLRRQEI